jgi:ribose transport system substrate-binding protein
MKRMLLSGVLAAVLAACGGPTSEEAGGDSAADSASAPAQEARVQVAFVTNNASEFWKIAEAGTKKAAVDFDCDVQFRIPSQGTAQEQQTIVEDLMTKGVSGLAISVKDPANQLDMLNAAAEVMNVVTQDSDAPDSNRACYIGTDNYKAGRAAGELVKQALPDGGKIMLFVGTMDAQNAQDRSRGVAEAIEGHGFEIIDIRTDETDQAKAITNAQDAIVKYPDMVGMVGLWAYNPPAILEAVRSAGKLGEIQIIGFDEDAPTLQGIKDGHIVGTIVQQPFEFGYQSVKLLLDLANGDTSGVPENKQIIVPVKTITPDNVDAFWTELKGLMG